MKTKSPFLVTIPVLFSALLLPPLTVLAQGTAFTYQGRLNDGANVANGNYDLRFTLFDASTAGSPQGSPITNTAAPVSNGFFTVTLDFGSVFPGGARFLEIAVRTNGPGGFTTLSPRQKVAAAPYAITASDATSSSIARLDVSNTTVPATGHPVVTSGFITSAIVDSGGSGYLTPPSVTVNDTTGAGAIITATVSNGAVAALTVNNAGANYSAGATLTIGVPPSNAYQIFGSTNVFSGVNWVTNANNVFAGDGSALSGLWRLDGNTGTVGGMHFVGTTDNQPLEIKVNNVRTFRIEPTANGAPNIIGGFASNGVDAGVIGATIAGGGSASGPNRISRNLATIGGGGQNTNQGQFATIGGGAVNTIHLDSFSFATISGGNGNDITSGSTYSTIAGGGNNEIQSQSAFVGGGNGNRILTNASYSVIGGGQQNIVRNGASYSTIIGGANNTILSNAQYAILLGGDSNSATNRALAAGRRAKANHEGAFVWADSQNADFASSGTNQFLIRASGGVGINLTNPVDSLHVQSDVGVRTRTTTTGTGFAGYVSENSLGEWFAGVANATNHWYLFENAPASGARIVVKSGGNVGIGTLAPTNRLHVAGGVSATAFVSTSDRHAKENFKPVSPQEILSKVAALPIATWNFKTMNDGRHMGPTAQDFHAAFGLGGGDTTITSVDPDGVALAAIQGLNERLEQRETELAALARRNERLEQRLEALEKAITRINHRAGH